MGVVGNMKVIRKRLEHLAVEHSKRFTKAWDYFMISTSAYMAGYKQAQDDILNFTGEELTEVDVVDGEHQLAISTFEKWDKENKSLSFKDSMSLYLQHFDITELHVSEKNGVISFQGTSKRK
jgi:hypothetical protein